MSQLFVPQSHPAGDPAANAGVMLSTVGAAHATAAPAPTPLISFRREIPDGSGALCSSVILEAPWCRLVVLRPHTSVPARAPPPQGATPLGGPGGRRPGQAGFPAPRAPM